MGKIERSIKQRRKLPYAVTLISIIIIGIVFFFTILSDGSNDKAVHELFIPNREIAGYERIMPRLAHAITTEFTQNENIPFSYINAIAVTKTPSAHADKIIRGLSRLSEITIFDTEMTEGLLQMLENCHALRRVRLSNVSKIDHHVLKRLFSLKGLALIGICNSELPSPQIDLSSASDVLLAVVLVDVKHNNVDVNVIGARQGVIIGDRDSFDKSLDEIIFPERYNIHLLSRRFGLYAP